MSLPAFFRAGELSPGERVLLAGEQAAHARSLRLRKGDYLQLLDGKGQEALCQLVDRGRSQLSLLVEKVALAPRPRCATIIALAMSKATRRGFFMEKAAELGAAAVWLWQAERSIVAANENTAAACLRQLVAGALQSHSLWFPDLQRLGGAADIAARAAAQKIDWRILPWEEQERAAMLSPGQLGKAGTTLFVIGPEGGLTEAEVEIFKAAGFAVVSLGRQILRCETAASFCLGLQAWASQLPGHPDAA